MSPKLKHIVCVVLVVANWIYLVILFSWLGVYLLTGDRFLLVALVNYLAVYLFYPLVLVLLTAILCQKRIFYFGILIGGAGIHLVLGSSIRAAHKREPNR